ncbi:MAG: hypothetical protein ABIH69_05570 [bacterium]
MKLKPLFGLVGVILLAVFLIIINLPEASLDFTFSENIGMWQTLVGSKFALEKDSVKFTKGNQQLQIVIPEMNIEADYYDVCVIEGVWPISFDQGSLLFLSPFNKQFDYKFRYIFETGQADRQNQCYIDLTTHGAWQSIVKALLIIPAADAKEVSLKRLKLVRANPWTKLKARWSSFIRYYDPLLGTCFSMASPVFMGKSFNGLVVPMLWGLLIICGLIIIVGQLIKINQRVIKFVAGLILFVVIITFGLLDLRNNIFYLKAISRNISLYWGKPIAERRGIVVGDPEFIDFMQFCDDNIPLETRLFNQVPVDIPGIPANYLSAVQYCANLRPRFYDNRSWGEEDSYYIFYKPREQGSWKISQEQSVVSDYLELKPTEKMQQEIILWRSSKYLSEVVVWLDEGISNPENIELLLLGSDRKTIAGRAKYLKRTGKQAIFLFSPNKNFKKGKKVFLQLKNLGQVPIKIGTVYGDQYKEGSLILHDEKKYSDLSFRLIYQPKDLKLFKRFSQEAFILLDEETQ